MFFGLYCFCRSDRDDPRLRPSRPPPTVSCHNFKSQNFKWSVSNPKNKYVAYLSVLSRISNCQSLGRKNKHENLKTDRSPPCCDLPLPTSPLPLLPQSSPLQPNNTFDCLSTLYSLPSTLYSLLSTLYSLPSTLYSLLPTLYSLLSTLCSLVSTLYSLLSTLYSLFHM